MRGSSPPERRPVVEMSFCIGEELHDGQFTLRDRSSFSTPVLLGRRFLSESAVIDPAQIPLTNLKGGTPGTRQSRAAGDGDGDGPP